MAVQTGFKPWCLLRRIAVTISLVAAVAGCASAAEKKDGNSVKSASESAPTLHPKDAEALVGRLSSGLLDATQLHGEVTPGGPAAVSYDQPDGQYSMQHDWSVWKLSPEELTRGFDRLREWLPRNGWRVTHYGRAHSQAQQPELAAVHEKDGASLSAELLIKHAGDGNGPGASKADLINFNVTSQTYRAPQGVDIGKY
ncbi:hypothetical protein [Streptomyces sp. NPDC051162]|uniref:hypothetical protein n=1 Tax=unclassified Streptomyces TaxID=2593676 RepID=UPI003420BECF